MSDYITTYSGEHFFPTIPNPQSIYITDIAHSLSLLCRGNGHVKTFFSVGQHCIHCALEAQARGYSNRVIKACLLHDASEAYMSDLPKPFKKFLPEYITWEQNLLSLIYEKFLGSDLSKEEQSIVKTIDDDMLYYELLTLLKEPTDSPPPKMYSEFSYDVLPFQAVEEQYLELFRALV